LLISCLFSAHVSAAVYQYQDENGKIVFTDEKVPGSVERKVQTPAIFKFHKKEEQVTKKPESTDNSFTDLKVKEDKGKAKPYKKFRIKKPLDDESYRDNLGNVHLQLDISPLLQNKHGHKIKVEFDGTMLKEQWSTSTITLSNISRGTHTVRAFIVDAKGKRIRSTKTKTFHLQRFSKFFQ